MYVLIRNSMLSTHTSKSKSTLGTFSDICSEHSICQSAPPTFVAFKGSEEKASNWLDFSGGKIWFDEEEDFWREIWIKEEDSISGSDIGHNKSPAAPSSPGKGKSFHFSVPGSAYSPHREKEKRKKMKNVSDFFLPYVMMIRGKKCLFRTVEAAAAAAAAAYARRDEEPPGF